MASRLPPMLKDAGLTAFVAAALGIFVVGFRTVDQGRGLGIPALDVDHAAILGQRKPQLRILLRHEARPAHRCVGNRVAVGPGARIITSYHREEGWSKPILDSGLEFAPVTLGAARRVMVVSTSGETVVLPGVSL